MPQSPAERMRVYRHRRRRQWLSVRIEIDAAEIDALVQRAYLAAKDRGDLSEIGQAVSAFLSDVLMTS